MNLRKLLATSLAICGFVGASAAGAATYSWTGGTGNLGAGGTGGTSDPIQKMTFTYDNNTQNLSVTARWSNTSADGAPEGAWLVLSDGAMPKALPNEVPIYYIDWKTGVNRITAYGYDGSVNDGGSNYFGSYDNKISVANGTGFQQISFTLNLAAINGYTDPAWKGGDFGSNVGVWFHWFDQNTTNKITYTGTSGAYKIAGLGETSHSYYDTGGNGNATTCTNPAAGSSGTGCNGGKVPVPGVAVLLGLGLLGLGVAGRRSFAK